MATRPKKAAKPQRALDGDWANIRLTPIEETDLELFYQWQNSPDIRDMTIGYRFPVTREAARDWMRSLRDQNGIWRVSYAIQYQGVTVGLIGLHSLDFQQRRALLSVYVGQPGLRNRGIGRIALSLLLDYAFNTLDLRKVGLEVLADNVAAKPLYQKLGFTHEGTKRQECFIAGRPRDLDLYGMLREECRLDLPQTANRLVSSIFD